MEKIYQQHWIELPKDIREHLAKVLGIPMSGIREIRDNTVISDGHTNEDLRVITAEKMADYVGSDGDFNHLWTVTVSKAKYELNPPIHVGGGFPAALEKEVEAKKFCDSCDSKGVRHKKECPKN